MIRENCRSSFFITNSQASQYKGFNYANAHVVTKDDPLKN
jgi:hypothetical protein